ALAAGRARVSAGSELAVLANLVADHATDRSATHGSQHTAVGEHCTGYAANARAGYCAFLPRTHAVPGRAACCSNGNGRNRSRLGEGMDFHVNSFLNYCRESSKRRAASAAAGFEGMHAASHRVVIGARKSV